VHAMSPLGSSEKSVVMQRAGTLLKALVRDLGLEDGVRLAQLQSEWHSIFRKPLSDHMFPSFLSGNELILSVDSPVWMQELKYYVADIVKTLAPYRIEKVRFKLGRVRNRPSQGAGKIETPVANLSPQERTFIEETVARVQDESLKTTVAKAMEKALKRRKSVSPRRVV